MIYNIRVKSRVSLWLRKLYRIAERILGTYCVTRLRELFALLSSINLIGLIHIFRRQIYTPFNIVKNSHKKVRRLEIGPGDKRIPGFETLDICARDNVDYVWDIKRRLPFKDGTFSLIYASHVLEHIPWFLTEVVLQDWYRILQSGGKLEIWVPDARKVFKAVLAAEESSVTTLPEEWFVKNPTKSLYKWAQGRLLYGANDKYPSWHHAFFTQGYLKQCLKDSGFTKVHPLRKDEVRGCGHGWINLGISGRKP